MPTVLVTGANRGLGLEFARQYRDEGWRVLSTVRDPLSCGELQATGAEILPLDVRSSAEVEDLAATLDGVCIDLLISNAAVYEGPDLTLDETDEHCWLDAFRTNSIGPLLLARSFRPHLKRSGEPKAIAITSKLGSISSNGRAGHYPYRTSKAALNAGWRAFAIDEPSIIAVLLAPGWVRTDMGGPKAALSPTESVARMRQIIAGLDRSISGKWLDHDGADVPW